MTVEQPHLFIIPNESKLNDQLKLFHYSFDSQSSLFGITSDCSNLFKIVQIGATDTKNSWFYGNYIIEDGRMFGLLSVLKGWIFLDLFSKCTQAKSLFLTIETVLSENEDSIVLEMFQKCRDEIEAFLKKLLPSQVNLEGDLGFRFHESEIISNLQKLFKDQELKPSELPKDLSYFEAKWQRTDSIVVLLDNLQFFLPSSLFSALCSALSLTPASPDDLNKRLKVAESLVIKPIKTAVGGGKDENSLTPTDDYTKYVGKIVDATGKGKNSKIIGNTSIQSFFKKATPQ